MEKLISVTDGAPTGTPAFIGLINIDATNNQVYVSRHNGVSKVWGDPIDAAGSVMYSLPQHDHLTVSDGYYESGVVLNDIDYWGKHNIIRDEGTLNPPPGFQHFVTFAWDESVNNDWQWKEFRVVNDTVHNLYIRRDGFASVYPDRSNPSDGALFIPPGGVIWCMYDPTGDYGPAIRVTGNYQIDQED